MIGQSGQVATVKDWQENWFKLHCVFLAHSEEDEFPRVAKNGLQYVGCLEIRKRLIKLRPVGYQTGPYCLQLIIGALKLLAIGLDSQFELHYIISQSLASNRKMITVNSMICKQRAANALPTSKSGPFAPPPHHAAESFAQFRRETRPLQ